MGEIALNIKNKLNYVLIHFVLSVAMPKYYTVYTILEKLLFHL